MDREREREQKKENKKNQREGGIPANYRWSQSRSCHFPWLSVAVTVQTIYPGIKINQKEDVEIRGREEDGDEREE